MTFTIESQTVKNYALLITQGIMKITEVPNLFNLKEVVESAINNQNDMEDDNNGI